MTSLFPRRAPYICQSCRTTGSIRKIQRSFSTTIDRPATLQEQLQAREKGQPLPKQPSSKKLPKSNPAVQPKLHAAKAIPESQPRQQQSHHVAPVSMKELRSQLHEVQTKTLSILDKNDQIPEEAELIKLLQKAVGLASQTAYAQSVAAASPNQSIPPKNEQSNSLAGELEESQDGPSMADRIATQADLQKIGKETAKALYTLLEDPKVYISDAMLNLYIRVLKSLDLPEYSPNIFHLYASKPIPSPGSSPIKYTQPWSRNPKYAVHRPLVEAMMDCAIRKRDMPLCVSIIDTTVATPQYFAAKFVRTASIPTMLAGGFIPASWVLSEQAAGMTNSWEPETFFWMCMAGGGAYLGTMGTLLYITVTTWNDHHKRVRWVPGTPMAKRWFREDERAFFDKMALAWGFQDQEHFGEETGQQWEALREMLGFRFMDLDRSTLLPGML